jgi:hypothetical protein
MWARTGYFLRKSPEIDDIAQKMHFHPLLCLAKVSRLGYPFQNKDANSHTGNLITISVSDRWRR